METYREEMNRLWKGIAIAGIWIGIGVSAKYTEGAAIIAIFGALATAMVAVVGEQ